MAWPPGLTRKRAEGMYRGPPQLHHVVTPALTALCSWQPLQREVQPATERTPPSTTRIFL